LESGCKRPQHFLWIGEVDVVVKHENVLKALMGVESGFDYRFWFCVASLFYAYGAAEPVDSAVREGSVLDVADLTEFLVDERQLSEAHQKRVFTSSGNKCIIDWVLFLSQYFGDFDDGLLPD
jgi:carbon starvation protein CstA